VEGQTPQYRLYRNNDVTAALDHTAAKEILERTNIHQKNQQQTKRTQS